MSKKATKMIIIALFLPKIAGMAIINLGGKDRRF
jgi:hypothetical protein